jgi:hypothetical protein
MLSVIYKPFCTECRYAECRFAECRYAKCRSALSPSLVVSKFKAYPGPTGDSYIAPQ